MRTVRDGNAFYGIDEQCLRTKRRRQAENRTAVSKPDKGSVQKEEGQAARYRRKK